MASDSESSRRTAGGREDSDGTRAAGRVVVAGIGRLTTTVLVAGGRATVVGGGATEVVGGALAVIGGAAVVVVVGTGCDGWMSGESTMAVV